jgi:hypothetical protein
VIVPLGKDPVVETLPNVPANVAARIEILLEENSDTYCFPIEGIRWNFTTGPNRYLVDGTGASFPLFDEETPSIQEDGFLGSPVEPALVDATPQAPSGSTLQPIVAKDEDFKDDDDYFSDEPDYDESHDAEDA